MLIPFSLGITWFSGGAMGDWPSPTEYKRGTIENRRLINRQWVANGIVRIWESLMGEGFAKFAQNTKILPPYPLPPQTRWWIIGCLYFGYSWPSFNSVQISLLVDRYDDFNFGVMERCAIYYDFWKKSSRLIQLLSLNWSTLQLESQ